MGEFVDPARFGARLRVVLAEKNALFTKVYGAAALDAEAILTEYTAYAAALRPFVTDTAALVYAAAANAAQIAMIDGSVGLIIAPHGRLTRVLRLVVENDRIVEAEGIGDPARVQQIEIAMIDS